MHAVPVVGTGHSAADGFSAFECRVLVELGSSAQKLALDENGTDIGTGLP